MQKIQQAVLVIFAGLGVALLAANLVVMLQILQRMPPTLAEIREAKGTEAQNLRLRSPVVHTNVLGSVEVYGQVDANIQ